MILAQTLFHGQHLSPHAAEGQRYFSKVYPIILSLKNTRTNKLDSIRTHRVDFSLFSNPFPESFKLLGSEKVPVSLEIVFPH